MVTPISDVLYNGSEHVASAKAWGGITIFLLFDVIIHYYAYRGTLAFEICGLEQRRIPLSCLQTVILQSIGVTTQCS